MTMRAFFHQGGTGGGVHPASYNADDLRQFIQTLVPYVSGGYVTTGFEITVSATQLSVSAGGAFVGPDGEMFSVYNPASENVYSAATQTQTWGPSAGGARTDTVYLKVVDSSADGQTNNVRAEWTSGTPSGRTLVLGTVTTSSGDWQGATVTDLRNVRPVGPPTGSIQLYAGSTSPAGWLVCDGSQVSRTTYANLFTAVGTAFGAGDGTTTFHLPDLRDRVPVGASGSKARGSTGGAETVQLTEAQLPTHDHSIAHNHPSTNLNATIQAIGGGLDAFNGLAGGTFVAYNPVTRSVDLPPYSGNSGGAGSNQAHNNMQPYVALNYLIKT